MDSGNDTCNLFSWQLERIIRFAKSSLTAEGLASYEGLVSVFYIAKLYSEILHWNSDHNILPLVTYNDNESLVDAIQTTEGVNDRRLRINISAVKDMILEHVSKVQQLRTKNRWANSLIKQGGCTNDLIIKLQNVELQKQP